MKKISKTLLSMVLAIAMVISLMPMSFAAGESGITIKYDITGKMDTTKTFTACYNDITTNGLFSYAADILNDTAKNYRIKFGGTGAIELYNGSWIIFEINVPVAGKYDVKINNRVNKAGQLLKTYIFQSAVTPTLADLSDENFIGSIDCNNSTGKDGSETPNQVMKDGNPVSYTFSKGEYYIGFKSTDAEESSSSTGKAYLGNIILDGGPDYALIGDMTITPDSVKAGGSAQATATAYKSNDGSLATVTYDSSNKAVATVDNNGAITAEAAGKTTITATAAGAANSISKDFVVTSANASDVTVKYDLNAAFGILTANRLAPVSNYITYDETNGFLRYVTDSFGDPESGKKWYIERAAFSGKYVFKVSGNQWICLEVDVPVAGEYSVSMYNGLYRKDGTDSTTGEPLIQELGGVMDVYVFKNSGQTIDNSVINAATPIGQVDCHSDTVGSTIVETPTVINENYRFDEAGKYYIVLKTNNDVYTEFDDLKVSNRFGIIGDIILDGGDGEAIMGNITLDPNELTTGATATATASGYSSKTGSAITADFVYSSSNNAVASVEGNTVTINGAGKATISATAQGYKNALTKEIVVNDIKTASFAYFINDEAMGSVTSSTGKAAGEVDSLAIDTEVKLTAEAKDGYEFKYWETALGNKFGNEITFKVTSNMRCKAVFGVKPSAAEILISFYNGNRDWLSTKTVAKNAAWSDIEKPDEPSILGYDFTNWAFIKNGAEKAVEDTDTFAENTNIVAKYEEVGVPVTVGGASKNFGEKITPEANGTVKCWKRGDKIVSFAQEYIFYANGIDDAITPVYEGDFVVKPIAVLESYNGQYMLEYDVPEGFTKLEAGIIYGNTTPKVNSYYSKAVVQNEDAHGQFTAIPNGKDAGMETVARGYVVYKTADGCIGVAYSD